MLQDVNQRHSQHLGTKHIEKQEASKIIYKAHESIRLVQ